MKKMKGCGGCDKAGMKTEAEIKELKKTGAGFGVASCDAHHTRYILSGREARQPRVCRTCYMGFDHRQWEVYSASKGDSWLYDCRCSTIRSEPLTGGSSFQGLGVLDPAGKARGRVGAVKAADVARLRQEDWQKERDEMVGSRN